MECSIFGHKYYNIIRNYMRSYRIEECKFSHASYIMNKSHPKKENLIHRDPSPPFLLNSIAKKEEEEYCTWAGFGVRG